MSDKGISAFAKLAYDLLTKKEQPPPARVPKTADVQAPRVLEVTKTHPDYQVVPGVGTIDADQQAPREGSVKDNSPGGTTGPRAYQQDAMRPAAVGQYERPVSKQEIDQRFAEHLKKAQARHPFVQEVRMPDDITDRYNQGFDRISDAVAPGRESNGMRLAADKVANAGRRLQNATITRSQEAMDSGYGRMAADLYGRVDGQDALPRRLVAKAVEKLAPDVPDIEFDQKPTELPEVTVEGENSLKKKK